MEKVIKLLSFIFICVLLICIIYKFDSINQTKKNMLEISKDLIVKATYTYEYKNGILNLNPIITEQITFENYITQNDMVCITNE